MKEIRTVIVAAIVAGCCALAAKAADVVAPDSNPGETNWYMANNDQVRGFLQFNGKDLMIYAFVGKRPIIFEGLGVAGWISDGLMKYKFHGANGVCKLMVKFSKSGSGRFAAIIDASEQCGGFDGDDATLLPLVGAEFRYYTAG